MAIVAENRTAAIVVESRIGTEGPTMAAKTMVGIRDTAMAMDTATRIILDRCRVPGTEMTMAPTTTAPIHWVACPPERAFTSAAPLYALARQYLVSRVNINTVLKTSTVRAVNARIG